MVAKECLEIGTSACEVARVDPRRSPRQPRLHAGIRLDFLTRHQIGETDDKEDEDDPRTEAHGRSHLTVQLPAMGRKRKGAAESATPLHGRVPKASRS